MAIDLSDYETGAEFDGDYDAALEEAQERLARIQAAYIVHGQQAVLVFEGWDASGKGGTIRRLVGRWEPRFYRVRPIGAPSEEERAHHYLRRFWEKLPGKRNIAIFDRSWYGRVLVERVEGFASEAEWRRAYDEINRFEAQQIADGTPVIKLFMHVTQAEQDERFRKRLDNPWKRWKLSVDDFRNRARREDYLEAIAEMFGRTDTPEAPWKPIDGNDKKSARITAMTYIAERLEAHVDMDSAAELDPEIARLAASHLGTDSEGKVE
ncbi:MAG: polyphosphate kinase 2 family protein [Parasphingopyxis sp.]|nr:polyphosphate kinase [Sphingomonadales bacterium]